MNAPATAVPTATTRKFPVKDWLQQSAWAGLSGLTFILLCLAFFLLNGHPAWEMFSEMVKGAFGDGYALGETLVKTAPILLCALSVALPARLGLISVGSEGQFYLGAMAGTYIVVNFTDAPAWQLMPMMLIASALGGAFWGSVPGLLKAKLSMNETISTLLLNYIAVLMMEFAVHGPWKDPTALGWPASIEFPPAAQLPTFADTRVHLGLAIGIAVAIALHIFVTYSRWGVGLTILRSNARVGFLAGISWAKNVVLVMAIGGALAGLAGIAEASVIQNRLQPNLSSGYGMSGFLVAWLAGQHFLKILPFSLLIGGLLASADSLQLYAQLPASSAIILQALLFVIVLAFNRRTKSGA